MPPHQLGPRHLCGGGAATEFVGRDAVTTPMLAARPKSNGLCGGPAIYC